MYVIICDKNTKGINPSIGLYAKFVNKQGHSVKDDTWTSCLWGKLNKATIFNLACEAESCILYAKDWAKHCNAQVTFIHHLNLLNLCT